LRAIPDYLVAVAQRHRAGVAAGRTPVRTLVDSAIAHVDRYLADPAGDPLRHPVPAASAAAFVEARDALLRREVRPAFARYRDVLATGSTGLFRRRPVWGGFLTGMRSALVRVHTTTGHTVDDLHGTGLDLIEALRGEYAQVGERAFGTGSQQEIFQQLGSLKWKDAAELLGSARAAIARAEAAAPQWFGVLPRLRCGVRAVPATEAPGAPLAYYFQPPLDGSRQGVYYANTHRAEERARFVSR
jgi:uncharacterized protein (DUF885 family)